MKKKFKEFSFVKDVMKNENFRIVLKILLSVAIVYHLLVIFLMPNQISMLASQWSPYLRPYTDNLFMNIKGSNHVLNPGTYFYLNYKVFYKDGRAEALKWPPSRKESNLVFFNHNRLIYHTQYFVLSGKKSLRRFFIPYLCRLHEGARKVSVEAVLQNRPRFRKARIVDPSFLSMGYNDQEIILFRTSRKCRKVRRVRELDHMEKSNDER